MSACGWEQYRAKAAGEPGVGGGWNPSDFLDIGAAGFAVDEACERRGGRAVESNIYS